MQRSESVANLAAALVRFQEEASNPKNTASNPMFKSRYAPLSDVINTVKPILGNNGLSFVQSTGAEGENIIIKTMLLHESGEWIESDSLVLPGYQPRKDGGKEFNAQGAGSAITYGRRFSLSAILGISSEDDDDANGQSHAPPNSPNSPNSPATPKKTAPLVDKLTAEQEKRATETSNQLKRVWQEIYGDLNNFEKSRKDHNAKGIFDQEFLAKLNKKLAEKLSQKRG